MKFFQGRYEESYTVIIGCGRLGAGLAESLSADGQSVLVMDEEEDSFRKLSSGFDGFTEVGDGTDFDDLQEAHIEKAQTALIVTDHDNANIMIAQIVKVHFQVPRVIARLYNPARKKLCEEFGIETICPSELSAQQIRNLLTQPGSEGTSASGESRPEVSQ